MCCRCNTVFGAEIQSLRDVCEYVERFGPLVSSETMRGIALRVDALAFRIRRRGCYTPGGAHALACDVERMGREARASNGWVR